MDDVAAIVSCKNSPSDTSVLRHLPGCMKDVAVLVPEHENSPDNDYAKIRTSQWDSLETVLEVLNWHQSIDSRYLLWVRSERVELLASGLQRLTNCARAVDAAIAYSDFSERDSDGTVRSHPLIDYQSGSLRDDFDFGEVLLVDGARVQDLLASMESERVSAANGGWYDLRLRLSERGPVFHLPESTYTLNGDKGSDSSESHFSYVDPRNRDYQIEMERIATAHLKRIGAFLPPPTGKLVEDTAEDYTVVASVVIPVRDRERTVRDAVESALSQRTSFPFNVIVVDNHSSDSTTQILKEISQDDARLLHMIPKRTDLGIGGCWNEAIYSDVCGQYVVQLDSDDLYSAHDVLQRIINKFQEAAYAMVVGSYEIVNFDLEQIPPGLIDHREWTDENGHNNALRIAGLGAPRAFHAATLRQYGFPNVSYGEDYAVALPVSGRYRVGRIYESLYLCRRWEDNSDHTLPLEAINRYAAYKDRLRSIEIATRQGRE